METNPIFGVHIPAMTVKRDAEILVLFLTLLQWIDDMMSYCISDVECQKGGSLHMTTIKS